MCSLEIGRNKRFDNKLSINNFEKYSFFVNYINLVFPRAIDHVLRNGDDQIFVFLKDHYSLGYADDLPGYFGAVNFPRFFFFLRHHSLFQFKLLLDIVCIDFVSGERFQLVYHLLSTRFGIRLNICVNVDPDFIAETLSHQYASADWLEREIWDMFGIFFLGHDDFRRILTDYGFESFPLRKDFPMIGFVEVFYSEVQKRIIFEPVELVQGFRIFDIKTSWVSELV